MTTINISVSSKKEANKVLSKVYAADNSATYSGRNAVSGSSISAIYRAADKNVKITSSYYLESSLIEMFN
jgi:hypothetical protein